jgi:hypothetical protein
LKIPTENIKTENQTKIATIYENIFANANCHRLQNFESTFFIERKIELKLI